MFEDGIGLTGTYEVDGNTVTLKADIGIAVRGTLAAGSIIDTDGIRWTEEGRLGEPFLGDWMGYFTYPGRLGGLEVDTTADLRVTVARDGSGFVVRVSGSSERVLSASYRDGQIIVDGPPEDFYKFQLPTVVRKEGQFWWMDGYGNYMLRRQ